MSAYLDHNASTPVARGVREAMGAALDQIFGNPSSRHRQGRQARTLLDEARREVAETVGVQPSQVIFTSGGTEANHLALWGIAAYRPAAGLAISAIEHESVTRPARRIAGQNLVTLPVDNCGRTMTEELDFTGIGLVSVMRANNETGAVQDLPAIAAQAHRYGALVHCDAVQALGKMPLNFEELGVDAMSLSAHKLGGPKGVGALVVGKALSLQAQLLGGGQEGDLRSGTENVPGIAGFARACTLASINLARNLLHYEELRCWVETELAHLGAVVFGQGARRLANTSFFGLPGLDGETLVMALDKKGFSLGSGSACASGAAEPSPVLLAMGVDPMLARSAVRLSLGPDNTRQQLADFLQALNAAAGRLKNMTAMTA